LGTFDTKEQAARAFDIAVLWLALRGEASEAELNLLDLNSPRATYADDEEALKGFATVHEAVEAMVEEGRRLKPEPASGYRGVYASREGWQSRIWHNDELTDLATFDTPEQAGCARLRPRGGVAGATPPVQTARRVFPELRSRRVRRPGGAVQVVESS
jgi:hypothetical protein